MPKAQEIKVTVDSNCKVDIKPVKPVLKPGDTVTWACDDECVVLFDGYNDGGKHGNKKHEGPLKSRTRIAKAGRRTR